MAMNERIKELAEQAGFGMWQDEHWNPGDIIDWSARYDDELEKFAALIVQECAEVCYNVDMEYEGEDVLATWCAQAINQHFGVKK